MEVRNVRTLTIMVLVTKVVILIGFGDTTLVIEVPIIRNPASLAVA